MTTDTKYPIKIAATGHAGVATSQSPAPVQALAGIKPPTTTTKALFIHPLFSPSKKSPSTEWPKETTLECFHCCAPFLGTPVSELLEIDDLRYTYKFDKVIFCSLKCLLGNINESLVFNTAQRTSMSHLGYRRFFLKYKLLSQEQQSQPEIAALPRATLAKFGGHLTLEQFKKLTLRDE